MMSAHQAEKGNKDIPRRGKNICKNPEIFILFQEFKLNFNFLFNKGTTNNLLGLKHMVCGRSSEG